MKSSTVALTIALFTCAAMLTACGGGDGANYPAASTPTQAAINMAQALKAGDRAAFRNSVTGEDWQLDAADVLINFIQAASRFEAAARSAYGDDADRLLQNVDTDMVSMEAGWQDNLREEIDGDRAQVYMDSEDEPLQAVRVGNEWKIDANDMFSNRQDAEMMTSMFSPMIRALDETRKEIEAGELTAEQAEQRLNQRMMQAMFGGMGQ